VTKVPPLTPPLLLALPLLPFLVAPNSPPLYVPLTTLDVPPLTPPPLVVMVEVLVV
jgi:hypothetical protein